MTSRALMTEASLTATLISMLLVQAMVVIASLGVAVIAPVLGPELGAAQEFASFYTTSIFLVAAIAVLPAPLFVARYGALRVSQVLLLFATFGLVALTTSPVSPLALSSIAIGLAYGPTNPASSHLLARHTPPSLRARIFSLKQISVPIGGVVAALAIPFIAGRLGWRVAILSAAGVCSLVALVIQPLRVQLDADRDPAAPMSLRATFDPLRIIVRDRRLVVLAAGSAIFIALQFTFSAMFVTFLFARASLSLQLAGQTLAMVTAASVLARPLWGWLADRIGSARVLALLGVSMGIGSILIALVTPVWSMGQIVALGCIVGATAMGWNGVYLAEVARICADGNVARATSGTMFITYLGALGGPLVYGLTAMAFGSLSLGFVILGAIAIVGGFMFLFSAPHIPPGHRA